MKATTTRITGTSLGILAQATMSKDKKFWICDWCKRKSPVSTSSDIETMLGKHDPGCKAVARIRKAMEEVDGKRG